MHMTLTVNKTGLLWKSFMPRRKEILHPRTKDLISLQVYHRSYFHDFNPAAEFEKWAAVEVSDFENVPDDMETLTVPGGLYAVFDYKGPSGDMRIFQYIFTRWLPSSGYMLDHRPHFEVLGKKYRNNDPSSEEEIWIPIQAGQTPDETISSLR